MISQNRADEKREVIANGEGPGNGASSFVLPALRVADWGDRPR